MRPTPLDHMREYDRSIRECAECGLTYAPGNPDDQREHRRRHRRLSLRWRSAPGEQIAGVDGDLRVLVVNCASKAWLRRRADGIGRRANLEMHYDFGVYDGDAVNEFREHAFIGIAADQVASFVVVDCRTSFMRVPWEQIHRNPVGDTWRMYTHGRAFERRRGWTVSFVWTPQAIRRAGFARRTIAIVAKTLQLPVADLAWHDPFTDAGRDFVRSLSPETVLIGWSD